MMACSKCEGEDVIRYGFNQTRKGQTQKYKCLTCKKMFCHGDRLPHNQVTTEIVSLTIDLYVKGLSYRVTQRQVHEQFGLFLSHTTIYRILQKYSAIIKKYVDSLHYGLSAVWQIDETVIALKSKPENKHLEGTGGSWCWVAIDTGSRFVLDMYITTGRTSVDAANFFKRLKESCSADPDVITTDGLNTYISPIKRFFPHTTHLQIKSITLHPNTSFIERFNGTIKNRTKTMRGFDAFIPCQNTLTLFQTYYNFLRPHMSLGGMTPAQAAGVYLDLPQRWTSLIRKALVFSG